MLLLDAGNSTIKAQWWQGSTLQSSFSCHFENSWQSCFEKRLGEIDASQCHYSTGQVEAFESELLNSLQKFMRPDNIHKFVALESSHGVRSGYQSPGSLGVDRWLCLLAARHLLVQDVIIVDAGSAITVDLMNSSGQHQGGAILPGFNTSLARFKKILHRADFDHADISKIDAPGCSTEACIQINYQPTSEAVVERLIDRWYQRLATDAALIVTGGDANRVRRHPDRKFRVVPDLVFKGMRLQIGKGSNESIF
jgi:type III pantothenate kinase